MDPSLAPATLVMGGLGVQINVPPAATVRGWHWKKFQACGVPHRLDYAVFVADNATSARILADLLEAAVRQLRAKFGGGR